MSNISGRRLPSIPPMPADSGITAPESSTTSKQTPVTGDFAWNVHAYTNEYIRFADGKAGAVIAWCSALIAGLYSIDLQDKFLGAGRFSLTRMDWQTTLMAFLALMSFLLLGLAAIAGMLAIWPRMWTGDEEHDAGWLDALRNRIGSAFKASTAAPRGFIFWESVRAHGTDAGYAEAIESESAAELDRQVALHVFQLGRVCKAKFFWVNRSVALAFVGSLTSVVVALLTS